MRLVDDVIPIDRVPGVPNPAANEVSALGQVDQDARARETFEAFRKGLDSRRLRDLTAEKYLLHIDGEGYGQWYDVYQGTRLQMTPVLNGISPTQDNQLSPIVSNFVAHLTTQPYRFVVEARPDREGRQSALVDQAIINAEVRSQKWNQVMAEAKLLACAAGFCPAHQMWRDEPIDDYEVIVPGMVPGRIDAWVGNPFGTVVNAAAKRGSAHRLIYERSLPAEYVRQVFGRTDLEGNDRMPSASAFQMVLNKWVRSSGATHGHGELSAGTGHEELIALLYDEILPGYDPRYPQGHLCITAIKGSAAARSEDARSGVGSATFLWAGPLPAGAFSCVPIYSHHRFDDWHGKPYITDIDEDQIELNQRQALLKEFQRRANKPPLGGSGEIETDTVGYERDTFFQVETQIGGGAPILQFLEYPTRHLPILQWEIEQIYERMYRKAGWQAASRGETSGESGKAIIALQTADDSIMGPIAMRTSEELEDMAVLAWRLRKSFMTVETVIELVGDELAHMAEPYVKNTMMSPRPPSFRLVSGFGTSTEAIAQQLLNLLGVTDALGEPVLTATQFKKKWPDQSLYTEIDDPRDVRNRRPRVVNELLRQAAERRTQEMQAQFPDWQPSMADPMTEQLGAVVEMDVAQFEDVLMDDDLAMNVEVLSIITQDPTEHPVARRAAIRRQMRYFMWLANQQGAQAQQRVAEAVAPKQLKEGAPGVEEAFHPAPEGATTTSQAMVQADKQFEERIA